MADGCVICFQRKNCAAFYVQSNNINKSNSIEIIRCSVGDAETDLFTGFDREKILLSHVAYNAANDQQ